ncbi:Uncharacterised protein g1689 [Pycnogonum litorale]
MDGFRTDARVNDYYSLQRPSSLKRIPRLPVANGRFKLLSDHEPSNRNLFSKHSKSYNDIMTGTSYAGNETRNHREPRLVISGKKTSRVLSNTNLELIASVTDLNVTQPPSQLLYSDNDTVSESSEDRSSEVSWPGDETCGHHFSNNKSDVRFLAGQRINVGAADLSQSTCSLATTLRQTLTLNQSDCYNKRQLSKKSKASKKNSINKDDIVVISGEIFQ